MNFRQLIPQKLKSGIKSFVVNTVSHDEKSLESDSKIKDLEIRIAQLEVCLHLYSGLRIPPPKHLQVRIVGGYFVDFFAGGFRNVDEFNKSLNKTGKTIADMKDVLDFGCGCGRVFLAMKKRYPHLNISGSEIDEEAVQYCRSEYSDVGDFQVNPPKAPSVFASNSFDFVYGISVFTHLPEDLQFGWLEDLQRITRPGAYLLLTVENKKTEVILNAEQKIEFENKGFYFFQGWLTDGLPDFYRTTLHSHDYVRKEWGRYFEVIDIIPKAIGNHQDAIIVRNNKPA